MFADLLRRLREKAGVSQYRLSRLSGLSKQMVSRLELGDSQPSWETVQRLVKALGAPYEALADPSLELPAGIPARRRGRPPKHAAVQTPARKDKRPGRPPKRRS